MGNQHEILGGELPKAVQRMWTSTLSLRGREFCSVLNDAVRADAEETAEPVAQVRRRRTQTMMMTFFRV